MRIPIIIAFILLGCASSKPTTERNHISFKNYSSKDAKCVFYIKTNEEDNYSDAATLYSSDYTSSMASDFSSFTPTPNENFYKVEYYLSDAGIREYKLIGTREYTRKELLVDKQGDIVINKRGKIKK